MFKKKSDKEKKQSKQADKKESPPKSSAEEKPAEAKGSAPAGQPVALVSIQEIAAALRMSPLQVQKMAQTSQIPAVKVDGEWRFNKDLVLQSIQRRSRGM